MKAQWSFTRPKQFYCKQHINTQNTNDQVPEAFRFFQQLPAVLEMQERENSFGGTCLHKPYEWQITTYTSFFEYKFTALKQSTDRNKYLRLLAGFASCLQLESEYNITQHESTVILHPSKTVLNQHINTQNTNDQVPEAFRFFQQLPAVLEMQERENSFGGTCLHKPYEWQITTYPSFSNTNLPH